MEKKPLIICPQRFLVSFLASKPFPPHRLLSLGIFQKEKIDVTSSAATFYRLLAGCHLGDGTHTFTDTKFHHLADPSTTKYNDATS
jgi:hypothetical protein